MNRYKMTSYMLVLLTALVVVGSIYVIVSYASDILNAVVDFVTTNDLTKLQQCGINTPGQFNKIKADLTTLILPFMYLGLPILFILISFLMFQAGRYHYRGKMEEESTKNVQLEREMVHKIVRKMEREKAPPPPPLRTEEAEEEEPEPEELPEESEEPEEEEVEEPRPKPAAKKRR